MTVSLRPYLPEYLQSFGIDTSKNFKCLNPKHQDDSPSMTCKSRPEAAFCFGCNFACDIFTAAHILEGKPISGKGWIEDNVMYLAKKFNVQVELEDLTQEEVYEYRTYKAYELAAELVSNPDFGDYTAIDEEIARRGWDKNKLASWGIGTVNYEEYRDRMRKAGFEPGFLSGIDLDRSNLFNNTNLLFTVYDEDGRPVGFSAKNLKYKKDDKQAGPKYINTRNTGLECAIFKKGERLYGFDTAKNAASPLYIFEGQANVITARHFGMMNCCCTMGTALTDHHVSLLKKSGCFSIVLVFDGDTAGQLAIQKVLDEKFSKERDFKIKLCSLPAGKDPDELMREEGFDSFVRLKKWTAFEWRLMKLTEAIDGDLEDDRRRDIAEKMIPIIASEKSLIRQEEMSKQVARIAGYELSTIISEVRRFGNEKDANIQTKKVNAVEAILSRVRSNPGDLETALAECQVAVDAINKTVAGPEELSTALSSVLALKEMDEAKTGEFSGFFMKEDGLGSIASKLDDDWRSGNLVFVGGGEQSSKTSLCCQMAYEIADDPRNEAICIYHSIDDAMKYIVYKWICNASNGLDITLNNISNPNYWAKQPGFEYIKELRDQAYKKVIRMIQEERLVVKDASDGPGLGYSESLIKLYRERHPSKNIVLFLDNFHKLPDYMEINGHERIKRLSNHLKNMTVMHRCTIVSTVEYRKIQAGEKPSNVAIAESRSLAYDANVIIHLYNDLHISGEDNAVLLHHDINGKVLPRIWVKFGKNKVSGYEGKEYLDLYPANAQLKPVDMAIALQEQKERIEYLKQNKRPEY
jgi:DNA primase